MRFIIPQTKNPPFFHVVIMLQWTPMNESDPFPQLREIPQRPKRLYTNGTLPADGTKFLAVVGSRKYSPYGKAACEHLIAGLRGYPVSIISGLALGIDTIAHRAALDAGLHTIAVPGSGLGEKVLYPATNRRLAQEIVEKGGLLLSEYEPDFRATVWSFPKRNRIMAGLSHAVLIVEAHERSGTLITARMALDYNRDVLAIPGSIFSDGSSGTNTLLRQGATLVRTADDILDALGIEKRAAESEQDLSDLSTHEQTVMIALIEPLSKDEIIRSNILETEDLSAALTLLEIKGLIKESGGKIYRI